MIFPNYLILCKKLMRELGKLLDFEPFPNQMVCTDAPGGRKTLIWTLFKDVEKQ